MGLAICSLSHSIAMDKDPYPNSLPYLGEQAQFLFIPECRTRSLLVE